jgi:hypothetical protein
MEEKVKKSLVEKLLVVQAELKAPKTLKNNFGGFNYRSCEGILEAVKPLLAKEGLLLLLTDEIVMVSDRVYVKATAQLQNVDNNDAGITVSAYAREALDKKGMDDSQITGASSSYARKYALNGLFCIDDNKDADTTNNGIDDSAIDEKQLSILRDYIISLGIEDEKFCKFLGVEKLETLPKSQFNKALSALNAKKAQKDRVPE